MKWNKLKYDDGYRSKIWKFKLEIFKRKDRKIDDLQVIIAVTPFFINDYNNIFSIFK